MQAIGCYVWVVASNATGVMYNSWTRGCCFDFGEIDHCTEIHEEVDNVGVLGRTDQSWQAMHPFLFAFFSIRTPSTLQVQHKQLQHDGPKACFKHNKH